MEKKSFTLKSLFISEPEPETPNTVPTLNTTPSPDNTPKDVPRVTYSKTRKILLGVLEEEGSKKLGYTQFKKSLSALVPIIPDEKTRIMSAFIASQSLGLTKENLIVTMEEAKKILEKEKVRFDSTVDQEFQKNIDGGNAKTAKLQEEISQKTLALQKLTEELSELQKQKKESEDYVLSEQNKIEELKKDFSSSYEEISGEIDSDISKIKLFLL